MPITALIVDDAEGEAVQDWRQGRDALEVCHISDGRGGHRQTIVQDHPSPDFTTWAAGTSADMIKLVCAGVETTQDSMGRCVQTRVNSTEGRLRLLLLGRKQPQRGMVIVKSFLKTSAVVRTIEENLPVMVTGWSIWEMSVYVLESGGYVHS